MSNKCPNKIVENSVSSNNIDRQKQDNRGGNPKVSLFRGDEDLLKGREGGEEQINKIKSTLSDLFNIKNLNFLFGAGTSSEEIPTMQELQKIVIGQLDESERAVFDKNHDKNLEEILEILYSGKTYLKNNLKDQDVRELEVLEGLISKIEETIFAEINIEINIESGVFQSYEKFYKKIAHRNKDLNRVNVFTTNNDLFNEHVLDYLNIDYNNGFGGGLSRTFNPARFEYIFSRKIDEGIEKYEPLSHMVYLYKLHGSINWVETQNRNSFFNIEEIYLDSKSQKPEEKCLIYPTPLKEGKSLTSPYTDLIREFQKKISLPNSVLFIIGYSFSDEHINTIIYRTLASSATFSVVIFADQEKQKQMPLFKIGDKRIYKIGGDNSGEKIHYFKYFVENFIPEPRQNDMDEICKSFIKSLKE